MTPEEIRAKLDAAINRLTELRALESLTDDQEREVTQNIRAVNELGPLLQGSLIAELSRQSSGSVHLATRDGQNIPAGAEEEYKSIGQRFAEMEAVKKLGQSDEQRGSVTMPAESFFMPQQRAIVTTGSFPANYIEPQRVEGFQRPSDLFGSLRDVLTVGQTDSDTIIYFRETAFTNAAAEVGEATATTGVTGLKPESALTFDEQTSTVRTIAHWIPITRQTLWNAPELRTYIETRLIDGLRLREDGQLLNGNGTAPNLRGILNTTGIQALDATYWTANPLASVGTSNENFDRILRAKTLAATVGRAQGNFVVLNPADNEEFLMTTDANRQYFGAGPFGGGGALQTLWGMRVVANENIAAGTALVGDGRQATIWDRMAATVTAGWANDDFLRNMLRLLAEERIGLTVFRPQAFVAVTLA